MSIATEEAERKYPAFSGDMKRRSLNMPFHIGYVNGRTADVTEEEIEAGARDLYELDGDSWDELHDESQKNHCRRKARIVLTAARVRVTNESKMKVSE